MASTFISSLIILYFLIYILTTLCFDRTSCKADFVKISRERLETFSHPDLRNYVNIVHNKTGLVERRFIFPGIISSTNVFVHDVEANVESLRHHIGHYRIKHSYDARMFYFFFESRETKNDPVILYLDGGPGDGCAISMFYANGPFCINGDLSLKWNKFGWDKISNLLFVDHLIGTGFSHSSDTRDIHNNTNEVVNDLYDFLQAFFQAHPEFINNEFYIIGSSYGGHFTPALASRLQKGNEGKEGIHINLKGIAMSSGAPNSESRFSTYLDFALDSKLISKSYYNKLKKLNIKCVKSIQHCQIDDNACIDSYEQCTINFNRLLHHIGSINPYDITKRGFKGFKFVNAQKELSALKSVMMALSVENKEYVFRSKEIFDAMKADIMKNTAVLIPLLLENAMKVLIFDGEYDMMCNWLGHLRWLDSMKWSGRRKFLKSDFTFYEIDGKNIGQVIRAGPLTYLKVHNVGHSVLTGLPSVALHVLKKWINS